MTTPRKTGRVSDDAGKKPRGPGSDGVGDNGLGRNSTSPRGPGKDSTGPESDILIPKRS